MLGRSLPYDAFIRPFFINVAGVHLDFLGLLTDVNVVICGTSEELLPVVQRRCIHAPESKIFALIDGRLLLCKLFPNIAFEGRALSQSRELFRHTAGPPILNLKIGYLGLEMTEMREIAISLRRATSDVQRL